MRPSVGIGASLCVCIACTVVLAGIVAGSGCTVLTNDGPPDDAGKFEGGDASTQTCATCLSDQCTGQMAACLTDPSCAAIAKRASSAACVAPDAGDTDGGADPLAVYGAFSACNVARAASGGACASDCTGSSQPSPCGDAGITDSGSTDASDASDDAATDDAGDDAGDASTSSDAGDAGSEGGTTTPGAVTVDGCTSCIGGSCGDSKKACAIGSECAAYLECAYGAADVAAIEECGRQHASGKTAAVELATCTRVGCSDACGF